MLSNQLSAILLGDTTIQYDNMGSNMGLVLESRALNTISPFFFQKQDIIENFTEENSLRIVSDEARLNDSCFSELFHRRIAFKLLNVAANSCNEQDLKVRRNTSYMTPTTVQNSIFKAGNTAGAMPS
jgi:uncharacterized protein YjbI with pentapeptide repeats